MNKTTMLAIIITSVVSFNVSAGNYYQLDKNKDGYISNGEAQNMPELAGQWSAVDSNQDGKIDQSEFASFEIAIDAEIAYK